MICVTFDEQYGVEFLKSLNHVECAEIRMEGMVLAPQDISEIFSQKTTLIAACRPGAMDNEERKASLIAAIEAGAEYVDIEIESDVAFRKEIVAAAESRGCKVIVSFHDYEKTPDNEKLKQIVRLCLSEGAHITKIACKINSAMDNAKLLGLLGLEEFQGRLIVTGMGDAGRITRVAAPYLGSLLTYVSIAQGKETAPGQITKTRLEGIMRMLDEE